MCGIGAFLQRLRFVLGGIFGALRQAGEDVSPGAH
jgi:hypothetical protein